jgi:tetratricopeptide (TPR) repeat protein
MGTKAITKNQIGAIVGAVVLIVLLLIAPTKPPKLDPQSLSLEQEIDSAIALVAGGNSPMQGIQALLALEKAHPENHRVLFNLALFSVQSGQFDKAVTRFEHLTSVQPENAEYWFHLARCNYQLANYPAAIREFEKVVETTSDQEMVSAAKKYLHELKNP